MAAKGFLSARWRQLEQWFDLWCSLSESEQLGFELELESTGRLNLDDNAYHVFLQGVNIKTKNRDVCLAAKVRKQILWG